MPESFTILNQLEKQGWQNAPINGGWRLSRHQAEGTVYMNITPQWFCLTCPLTVGGTRVDWNVERSQRVRFYRGLLQQNEQMFMARYSLDGDGLPLLMVELPAQGTSSLLLNWALESLARYTSSRNLSELGGSERDGVATARKEPMVQLLPDTTPRISRETIAQYIRGIEVRGWGLKSKPQGYTWHLGYKGRLRVFDVYLSLTRTWIYFQVPALIEQAAPVLTTDALRQAIFLEYLLHLNNTWFMAKLAISKEGQVLLLLEVPTETLDFSLFQLTTRTLAIYLDRCTQEIQIMASLQHDDRLAKLLA